MKKISYILLLIFLISCTSNTIFEKPKDLIPKDTMSLLMQDMMIASSSKFVKNINKQKKINYMAFVYEKHKIDSLRFQNSNFYYISKIDMYEEIIADAEFQLKEKKELYSKIRKQQDSVRKDSIQKIKRKEISDTIFISKINLDTLKKIPRIKNKLIKGNR